MSAFVSVTDLSVTFPSVDGDVRAVQKLNFAVERGKTLGIVGESGSGKSTTSLALMGLYQGTSAQLTGSIQIDGKNTLDLPEPELRAMRGATMAMIFQDPLSAMHPMYTVGHQIVEAYRIHHDVSKKVALGRAVELLDRVGIPEPDQRVQAFPHQFSGGMRQRAMIAMALSCNPALLIADEPTTALDVTVQAQILDLITDLQAEFNSAVLFITHDLGVVAETCDDVLVMYAGRAVEQGSVDEIFDHPAHPYTWGLLNSMPTLDGPLGERLEPIQGIPPSLLALPEGCAFHPRCAHKIAGPESPCVTEVPNLDGGADHQSACHLSDAERKKARAGQR